MLYEKTAEVTLIAHCLQSADIVNSVMAIKNLHGVVGRNK